MKYKRLEEYVICIRKNVKKERHSMMTTIFPIEKSFEKNENLHLRSELEIF